MFSYFTDHDFLACERCGLSLSRAERVTHVCDAERRAQFEAFQIRHEVAELDRELSAFLESPGGRFAVYYAERERQQRGR